MVAVFFVFIGCCGGWDCNGGYFCFLAKAVVFIFVFVFIFMRYLVAMAVVVAVFVFVFMRCCGGCFFVFVFMRCCGGCFFVFVFMRCCGGGGGCFRFRFHAVLRWLFSFSFIWAVLADRAVRSTFGPNGPAWAVRAAWQKKLKATEKAKAKHVPLGLP